MTAPASNDNRLRTDFSASAAQQSTKSPKRKRIAPLSIRVTKDEREFLVKLAGKLPVSTYIKQRLFCANDNVAPSLPTNSQFSKKQLLAQILGKLAKLEVFAVFKAILSLVENGQTNLKPETEAALQQACRDIGDIRRMLIEALGIKSQD